MATLQHRAGLSPGMTGIAQAGEGGACTSRRTAWATATPIRNPPAAVATGSCAPSVKTMPDRTGGSLTHGQISAISVRIKPVGCRMQDTGCKTILLLRAPCFLLPASCLLLLASCSVFRAPCSLIPDP